MVYYYKTGISIPTREEQSASKMTVSMSLTTDSSSCFKSKHNQLQKNKRVLSSSPNHQQHQMYTSCCEESELAVIDVMILIAVLSAFGFLLYPYVVFTYVKFAEISSLVFYVLRDEIHENPIIYGSLGVSMVCVTVAAWTIVMCMTRKCEKHGCRGLWKAAEFDIQLETEDCVRNSNVVASSNGFHKGLFELPRDHHRELEVELRKIAPPNGRAVLVFRARCGCSVGRMEVPGPKRVARKIKK